MVKRVDGEIQSGVKPPQSKKQASGLNFGKNVRRRDRKIAATLGKLRRFSIGPGG
jgi:hypothetical protein